MARRRAGLSQRELGRRTGVAQSTISKIERGLMSPTVDSLEPLIEACGMELEVVEPLSEGVDRSLIWDALGRTPSQRVRYAVESAEALGGVRRAPEVPA